MKLLCNTGDKNLYLLQNLNMNRLCKYLFVCLFIYSFISRKDRLKLFAQLLRVLILHFVLPFIYPFRTFITFPYFATKTVKNILRFIVPMLVTVI